MDLVIVFLIGGFLPALDSAMFVPTLWLYSNSLGGDGQWYGILVASFWVVRFASLALFGYLSDRRPYSQLFIVSLITGAAGGVCYSLGPWIGVAAPLLGRCLLGFSSAAQVTTQAYLSKEVRPEDRTSLMALNTGINSACIALGPALNLLFVFLPPAGVAGKPGALNPLTWPGLFAAFANLVVLAGVLFCFTEPSTAKCSSSGLMSSKAASEGSAEARESLLRPDSVTDDRSASGGGGGGKGISLCAAARHIAASGAWVSFVVTLQNNFQNQAVTWALPLIAASFYSWGQLYVSLTFGIMSACGIASVLLVAFRAKHMHDRTIMVVFQAAVFPCLVAFAYFFGCGVAMPTAPNETANQTGVLLDSSGQRHSTTAGSSGAPIPPWLFVLLFCVYFAGFNAQIPGNIAIYTRLTGSEHAGVYQAALQMVMAVGRAAASYLVGSVSFEAFGPCALFATVLALWLLQWVFFLPHWSRFHPDAIDAFHRRRQQDMKVEQDDLAHGLSIPKTDDDEY